MNDTGLKPQNNYILCEEVAQPSESPIVMPDSARAANTDKHILRILEDAQNKYPPGTRVLVTEFRPLVWNRRKLAIILAEEVVVTLENL